MKNGRFSLDSVKKIAFIMSPRLGDCLISMIVSHNLRRNGYEVTSFNNYLATMRDFFPEENIQPNPDKADGKDLLKKFDLLIFMADYNVPFECNKWHPSVIILDDYSIYHRPINMVEIQIAVCREIFGLKDIVSSNGFTPVPALGFRKYSRRVVIHPSASSKDKQWTEKKFIQLAYELKKRDFHPVFVIASSEKPAFSWIIEKGFDYIANPNVNFLPAYLYESGWFVGNDSGVGHLASNVGISTLTLMARKSVSRRWHPGWAHNETLLPWMPLLLRPWKMKYWKHFISVNKVLKTFEKMTLQPIHKIPEKIIYA